MAEGGGRSYHEERAETIQISLEAFQSAIDRLKAAGLTHQAAIKKAGQMFELDIKDEDIAAKKNGRARAQKKHKKSR